MDRNTTTTDCISRIDAIKVVIEALKEYAGDGVIKCTDGLRSLPPVTPKERKGEWNVDVYGVYHCPFCHAINNTVYKNFCPNCGAKMDKEANNE